MALKNKTRLLSRLSIASVLACGLLAAALPVGAPALAQQEPIKVGLLFTYVGPTALFARYEAQGARLHIDQVNAAGGINGRKIELVNYDTEGKPDRAGSLFRRLANEDKVVAVIGPDSIFVLLGMASVPSEVKVLSVAAPGSYEMLSPKDRTHVVSGWAPFGYVQGMGAIYMRDKLGVKRMGMLTTADAVGDFVAREQKSAASLAGIEIVEVVSQPASDRDLLPSLRKLAAIRPPIEGLMIFGSGPFGTIAMNQTELAGIKVPLAYVGGNVIPELIKELSPETGARTFIAGTRAGVHDTLPKTDPYYAVVTKFAADYRAKYNEPATLPAAVGYDMALAVTDAIRNVGPDPEKIRDYVVSGKQKNLVGVQGVTFNRTPGYGYGNDPTDQVITSIEGGKFVFKAYLKDSFKSLGIADEAVRKGLHDFKIIAD